MRVGWQAELLEDWNAIDAAATVGGAEVTYVPLMINAPYMEFIHESAWDADQPAEEAVVGLEGLQAGERYEVVLTTREGLVRYRMGDIIRCVGRFHDTDVPR